ncbi:MAG: gliding motility lipoprotein GldD [Bacteroidota bacterium]|nr:gliding motility lipoprotein GldD [Bacteroidota bacterium]
MKTLLIGGFTFAYFFLACQDMSMPKPNAMLRLKYPTPNYKMISEDFPFTFEYNSLAKIKRGSKEAPNIEYELMDATLYLSYLSVSNNLDSLLNDAYKLPAKHMIKADEIPEKIFLNHQNNVYGALFSVVGDAASQIQFFLTDSTQNFLMGSLYFYSRPNYDSIMPAAKYIERDVVHLMETVQWNN